MDGFMMTFAMLTVWALAAAVIISVSRSVGIQSLLMPELSSPVPVMSSASSPAAWRDDIHPDKYRIMLAALRARSSS